MYGWVCLMPSDHLFGRSVSASNSSSCKVHPQETALQRNCTSFALLVSFFGLTLICTYFALTLHSFCTYFALIALSVSTREISNKIKTERFWWETLPLETRIRLESENDTCGMWNVNKIKHLYLIPNASYWDLEFHEKLITSTPSWLTSLLWWNHLHHRSTSFRFSVLVVVIITSRTFQKQDSALMTNIDGPCHSCHLW